MSRNQREGQYAGRNSGIPPLLEGGGYKLRRRAGTVTHFRGVQTKAPNSSLAWERDMDKFMKGPK